MPTPQCTSVPENTGTLLAGKPHLAGPPGLNNGVPFRYSGDFLLQNTPSFVGTEEEDP